MGNKFKDFRFIDGELYITCTVCKQEQHEEYFWRHHNQLGRNYKCKACHYNYSPNLEDSDDRFAIPARKILESMGYEVDNKKNPVYKQFEKRIFEKKGRVW